MCLIVISDQGEGKLTTKEDKVTGSISKDTLYAYIRASGGVCLTLIAAFSVLLNVGSTSFSSWWLAMWLKAGGGVSQHSIHQLIGSLFKNNDGIREQ